MEREHLIWKTYDTFAQLSWFEMSLPIVFEGLFPVASFTLENRNPKSALSHDIAQSSKITLTSAPLQYILKRITSQLF